MRPYSPGAVEPESGAVLELLRAPCREGPDLIAVCDRIGALVVQVVGLR